VARIPPVENPARIMASIFDDTVNAVASVTVTPAAALVKQATQTFTTLTSPTKANPEAAPVEPLAVESTPVTEVALKDEPESEAPSAPPSSISRAKLAMLLAFVAVCLAIAVAMLSAEEPAPVPVAPPKPAVVKAAQTVFRSVTGLLLKKGAAP
jgi:hypothetical protein